jgi:hypothetical protein
MLLEGQAQYLSAKIGNDPDNRLNILREAVKLRANSTDQM